MEQHIAHELLYAWVHRQRARQADAARVEDSTSGRPFPVGDVTTTMLLATVPLDVPLRHCASEKDLAR